MLAVDLRRTDLPKDPETVRSLLSNLSNVSEIGVVEALDFGELANMSGTQLPEPFVIVRAYSDSHTFTIFQSLNDVEVVEAIGPKAIREWRIDDDDDAKNAVTMMVFCFGSHVAGLERLRYLYTEHSSFVWKPLRASFLPNIKRRAFLAEDSAVVALHSKHSDIQNGERLVYILETPTSLWRYSCVHRQGKNGQWNVAVTEQAHAVEEIDF